MRTITLRHSGSAAVACHPSFLAVPADLEGISKPISIAVGDKVSLLSNETETIRAH